MHLGERRGASHGNLDVTGRHLHRDGDADRELALAQRALHERQIGVELGRRVARVLHRSDALRVEQTQGAQHERAAHQVDVRVVEAGNHQPSAQGHDLRLGATMARRSRRIPDVEDATVADGDRLGPGPRALGRPHAAAGEQQVGGCFRGGTGRGESKEQAKRRDQRHSAFHVADYGSGAPGEGIG